MDQQPELEHDFTKEDWLYFGIAILLVSLEFYFMWDWCQWFNKCY